MNHVWGTPSLILKLLAAGLAACFVMVMSLGVFRESHPGSLVDVLQLGVKLLGLALALAIVVGALIGWRRSRNSVDAIPVALAVLGVAALVAFQVIASQEGPDSADIGSGALVPLGLGLSVAAALKASHRN